MGCSRSCVPRCRSTCCRCGTRCTSTALERDGDDNGTNREETNRGVIVEDRLVDGSVSTEDVLALVVVLDVDVLLREGLGKEILQEDVARLLRAGLERVFHDDVSGRMLVQVDSLTEALGDAADFGFSGLANLFRVPLLLLLQVLCPGQQGIVDQQIILD